MLVSLSFWSIFYRILKKNQKVLDVGFGSGVYGKLLRTFYYRHVDGIDVFDKNLEIWSRSNLW